MKPAAKKPQRCAIYTRVSTDIGLEQEFNSLHAQREAAQAYIKSQAHEGWKLIRDHYDDGGFSGGSLDRPGKARRLHVNIEEVEDRLALQGLSREDQIDGIDEVQPYEFRRRLKELRFGRVGTTLA